MFNDESAFAIANELLGGEAATQILDKNKGEQLACLTSAIIAGRDSGAAASENLLRLAHAVLIVDPHHNPAHTTEDGWNRIGLMTQVVFEVIN